MSARHRPPSYRYHKARQSAVSTVNGKNFYLGAYGSLESYQNYLGLLSRWLTQKFGQTVASIGSDPAGGITVAGLILEYWKFATTYYVKSGKATDEQYAIRSALSFVRELYGHSPAPRFGAAELEVVRNAMIEAGLSRGVINGYVNRIVRAFRWAASKKIVPVCVPEELRTVDGLKSGRTRARETEPVRPVAEEDVQRVLPLLSQPLRTMVQIQLLAGCRPQEICMLRPCDIDRSNEEWRYEPPHHKTEHHGRRRTIFFGPRARKLLEPWLLRADAAYCFSPKEAAASERKLSTATKTQADKAKRPRVSRRGEHYTTASYRRAITRACARAKIDVWSPNQLRHTRATELRKLFGLEPTQVILGHAKADTTQIYAERDLEQARNIMRQVG
ncbi:MAG: site-specific integrase [Planctomycetia bacterium]|nr:site-specific integrase [Planctomycetia bacterium]